MHALLLSFCRYFAKIADAREAMSLSFVKCQVKTFFVSSFSAFYVTMIVAIEFHSRPLIQAYVRSRRHFAKFCTAVARFSLFFLVSGFVAKDKVYSSKEQKKKNIQEEEKDLDSLVCGEQNYVKK